MNRHDPMRDHDGNRLLLLPQAVYDAIRGDIEADRAARSYEIAHDARGNLQAAALFNIKVTT